MDIEFDEEGGYADVAVGYEGETHLRLFRENGVVRVEIDARNSQGEIGLGVGLDAEQAHRVGEHLIAKADALEDDED